jgi:hypothetical protein
MIKGKADVLAFIKSNDTAYWTIFPYQGGRAHCIFKSSDEADYSLDKSLEKLSDDLDLLQTGRYVISAKSKADQTKGLREDTFEHTNIKASTDAPIASVGAVGATEEIIAKHVNDALQRFQDKLDNQKLQDRIMLLEKELKDSKDSNFETAISGIIKKLDPYVDPLLDHMFPASTGTKIAVSGFKKSTTQNTTTLANTEAEATARVQKALDTLLTLDPERALLVIEKIAETAEKDYPTYNMYVAMLLK